MESHSDLGSNSESEEQKKRSPKKSEPAHLPISRQIDIAPEFDPVRAFLRHSFFWARQKEWFWRLRSSSYWHNKFDKIEKKITLEEIVLHALKNSTDAGGSHGNRTARVFHDLMWFPANKWIDFSDPKAVDELKRHFPASGSQEQILLRQALLDVWIDIRTREQVALGNFHSKHAALKQADAKKWENGFCFGYFKIKRPTFTQVKPQVEQKKTAEDSKIFFSNTTQDSLVSIIEKARTHPLTRFFSFLPRVYSGTRSAEALKQMSQEDVRASTETSEELVKKLIQPSR